MRTSRLAGLFFLTFSLSAAGCAPRGQRAAPAAGPGAAAGGATASGGDATPTLVYVGLPGEIAIYKLDTDSGALGRRGSVPGGRQPSALAHSTEREVLIAVDEGSSQVSSFAINAKTGGLTPAGRAPAGGEPSGVTVDASGKYALTAHRGAGSVTVLAIKPDGSLGTIDTFRSGAGAADVTLHPKDQIAFVANERASSISQFTFNTGTGMLTPKAGPPLTLPPGSGPTRFAFHPSGRWVYLIDEGRDAVSVHAYDVDLKGLSPISEQIVPTLPEGFAKARSRPVALAVRPDGRFLYVANRGHDSIATFSIEPSGQLKLVGHEPSGGRAPGALAVDPSGAYLFVANEGSKVLSVFHLDPTTGAPGGRKNVTLAGSPLSVLSAKLPSP
jgi:6-phosphogluconolactonase